ncbi:RNA polymerase sporulation sigma factor SigF [Lachnospiraceae bacterium AM23-2LB]|nr:RNA polymerase sporulation sigma factor SigF [Lachnospiraceae bacterium AM23-2LB]RJW02207.1 RNA polymerase sporulation sigma factor SigF [Lachnospiraceae bacterium AM40-2BH]
MRHGKCGTGDASDVHNEAGSGSIRNGVCVYGGVYGPHRGGVGAGSRDHGDNGKNNRKRKEHMDHTIDLIRKSHAGDKEARERLVEENVGLIWCVVKRFAGRGTEAEDLFQIGSIGLLKAIDKFDLSYDVKFSTYAVPMITGEIKRFLRDDGMIKVSRSLKELSYKAYLKQEELQEKNGRDPTIEELAEALSVSTEDLTMAMEASGDIESLQKSIYQKDGQEIRLMDKLPGEKREEERILDHLLLNDLLNTLGSKERKIIYLRYFANHTQSQIGKVLGISQVQVSRMEKQILKKMRENV